jgi:hypothetical protein
VKYEEDANVIIEKYVGLPPTFRALSHVPELLILGLLEGGSSPLCY